MAEQDPKSKIYDPPRLIFCYTLLPHFVYLQTPLFPSTLFFTYFHGHSLFLKQLDDVSRSDPTGKETGSECLTLKVIPSRLTQQRQWLQQTSLVGAWGVEETEPLKENLPVTGTGAHVLASPNLSYLLQGLSVSWSQMPTDSATCSPGFRVPERWTGPNGNVWHCFKVQTIHFLGGFYILAPLA